VALTSDCAGLAVCGCQHQARSEPAQECESEDQSGGIGYWTQPQKNDSEGEIDFYDTAFLPLYARSCEIHIFSDLMAHAQAVFDELCDVLNPQKKPYVPKKGKPNVIMFVGLQVLHDEPAT
jgi:hypothetical protein